MNNTPHIAIIGAGQVGSRHLQSLGKTDRSITVSVIDPNPSSLETAKARYLEIPKSKNIQNILYSETLEVLNGVVDVAIIATNADVRRKVVEKLLEKINVRYMILEKVAFQSVEDFEFVKAILDKRGIKAWVNCTLRITPYYMSMKKELRSENFVYMYVNAGNFGIGTGMIHLIDLLAYLTGERKILIDTSRLDNKIYKAKREQFVDFGGSLTAVTPRGDQLILVSHIGTDRPAVLFISSPNHSYIISPHSGKVLASHKKENWRILENVYVAPYQSELTFSMVQKILDTGKSDFTNIEESFVLHKSMLEAFNAHLEKVNGEVYTRCPIT